MDPVTTGAIIIASINGGCLIISEILGSRHPENNNLCRSLFQLTKVGCQWAYKKIKSKRSGPEEIELKPLPQHVVGLHI